MTSTGSLTGDTSGAGDLGDRRPAADRAVRRVLRVPERRPASEEAAHRIFSVGIVLSALRCLLTYIFLPVLAPLLGVAGGVGPSIGIPLSVVALTFDIMGIRRYWLADHRWRWPMTVLYLLVMGLVVALLVGNIQTLTR
jgi:hypothetical protein